MATVTITIPTAQVNRVFDAIADEAPINGAINPSTGLVWTKTDWAKKWLDDLLTKEVSRYETKVAKQAVAVAEDPALIVVT